MYLSSDSLSQGITIIFEGTIRHQIRKVYFVVFVFFLYLNMTVLFIFDQCVNYTGIVIDFNDNTTEVDITGKCIFVIVLH